MPYWALDLGAPSTVEANSGGATKETGPDWSTITYQFAARKKVGGGMLGAAVGPTATVEQPAVKFVWYDGLKDEKQNAPYELIARATEEARRKAPPVETDRDSNNETKKKRRDQAGIDSPQRWDLLMVGDRGIMLFNRGNNEWIITPGDRAAEFANVPKSLPRVANEDVEWVESCRGGAKALSSFDYAGPFTEAIVLGTLAIRLGKKIEWDTKKLKVTNVPEADALIRSEYRKGWSLPVSDDILGLE